MKFIDFFAGVGGFRRGMELAGHECVGFCEFDKFATASWMVRAGRNFSWSGMGSASGMGAELHERKIPGGSNERRH